jgi:hypothetical protein
MLGALIFALDSERDTHSKILLLIAIVESQGVGFPREIRRGFTGPSDG